MVRVHNRAEVFRVEMCCCICLKRCTLDQLWLAFPTGERSEGRWVHRPCTTSRVSEIFGTKRITLMAGRVALERLVESLVNDER
jgi:hypothetical protein